MGRIPPYVIQNRKVLRTLKPVQPRSLHTLLVLLKAPVPRRNILFVKPNYLGRQLQIVRVFLPVLGSLPRKSKVKTFFTYMYDAY